MLIHIGTYLLTMSNTLSTLTKPKKDTGSEKVIGTYTNLSINTAPTHRNREVKETINRSDQFQEGYGKLVILIHSFKRTYVIRSTRTQKAPQRLHL